MCQVAWAPSSSREISKYTYTHCLLQTGTCQVMGDMLFRVRTKRSTGAGGAAENGETDQAIGRYGLEGAQENAKHELVKKHPTTALQ